jgi:hypothetical protein
MCGFKRVAQSELERKADSGDAGVIAGEATGWGGVSTFLDGCTICYRMAAFGITLLFGAILFTLSQDQHFWHDSSKTDEAYVLDTAN